MACCASKHQKKQQEYSLWRSSVALIAGIFMLTAHHFSLLHWMLHSLYGSFFCFAFCTGALIFALRTDLKAHADLALKLILTVGLILMASQVGSSYLAWGMNISAVGLFSQAFFVKPEKSLITSHDWPCLSFVVLSIYFSGSQLTWPLMLAGAGLIGIALNGYWDQRWRGSISIESSIVVSAVLAWSCSVAGLFFSAHFPFGVFFHDSLLAVGAYQMGQYFRGQYKDRLMGEGGDYPRVIKDGKEIDPRHLKDGDVFQLKQGQSGCFPFPLELQPDFKGSVIHAADESRTEYTDEEGKAHSLPAFTNIEYTSGHLQAKGAFVKSAQANEVPEKFLFFIMVVSLGFGILTSWYSGSILAGFSQFAISVMGACPCVFVFSSPIIGIRAMQYLAELKLHVNSDSVFKHAIDVVVFDRTHTLYHQAPGKEEFQLGGSVKGMVDRLKRQGIRVMVLSGHESDQAENRRITCATELGIDQSDILFGCQDKEAQVLNIKRQGAFIGKKPRGSGLHVLYAGDGMNDVKALQAADVAVAVGVNHQVQEVSHLRMDPNKIHLINALVDVIAKASPWVKSLTYLAYAYNLVMLMMANGLSAYLLAVPLQASVACLAMMVFSTLSLCMANQFDLKKMQPGGRNQQFSPENDSRNLADPLGKCVLQPGILGSNPAQHIKGHKVR
ncbi:HAD family hydrolase [Gammaproteobacteria bacterium]|nr:HAD family hydrolase [Gammaproteobacteria bacterium]